MTNEIYEKILMLTDDSELSLTDEVKNLLGKELYLGMSNYAIRYGCLSPGHEKLTASQRYYQSIKEIYHLRNNILLMKATAKGAQADLLDARDELDKAVKHSDKLRAESKIMMAENKLTTCLVTVEDQMRQVAEFNRVRLELKNEVRAQYPEGIEQAEEDNNLSIAAFRSAMTNMNGNVLLTHIPLSQKKQAELARITGRREFEIWEGLSPGADGSASQLTHKEPTEWQRLTTDSLGPQTLRPTRD